MNTRPKRIRLGFIIALAVAVLGGSAGAVISYKAAVTFGTATSWNNATAGYVGAVQGAYATTAGPVWHFANGSETSMIGAGAGAGTVYVQTFSATPTFTPANGDTQLITLTANITSWTLSAGTPGEILTIIWVQDATGSRTLSGTPSNVKLAGTFTLSTAANARDSLTLRYDSVNAFWQEIGRGPSTGFGGGASTGNWTFSGNTADLTGAATMGIGTSVATAITLGGTQTSGLITLNTTQLRVTQNAQDSTAANSAFRVVGAAHTNMTASTEYIAANFNVNSTLQWATGSLATERVVLFQAPTLSFVGASNVTGNAATVAISGAPAMGTNATLTGNAWALWLQAGNLGMAANTSIANSAQAATNTTALTIAPNVADGASSVALDLNTGTTLSNATAKMLRIRNNSTEIGSVRLNNTDGIKLIDGGGSSAVTLSTNAGTTLCYGSACYSAGSGSVTMGDGTGQISMSSGNVVATVLDFSPEADNTRTFGSAHSWKSIRGQHLIGSGSAPTIAAGACIGGTQTVSVQAGSTDTAGTISLAGTATGTASATCATVSFNLAFGSAPRCQIAPANAAASALSGTSQIFLDNASTSTASFVVKVGSTALVAGTYLYNYDCTQ